MGRHAQHIVRLAFITVLTLPIAAVVGLIILHVRGERLLVVRTASMVPAFRPGDAIIVRPVSPSELRPGDIVSYRSPQDPRVIGRVTAVAPGLGSVLDTLRQPLSLALIVYLPAALIIVAEARRLSRYYARPTYLLNYRYGTKS